MGLRYEKQRKYLKNRFLKKKKGQSQQLAQIRYKQKQNS